jgi:hypothetical protein
MDFEGAKSYRFFLRAGTDFEYELALIPAVNHSRVAAGGFEHGGDYGVAGAFVRWRVGGRRGVAGASG